MTQSFPQSLTALCAPGPDQVGRELSPVTRTGAGLASPLAKEETLDTANPLVNRAKYARVPSLLTDREWRSPPEYPFVPLYTRTGGWPSATGEMSQTGIELP